MHRFTLVMPIAGRMLPKTMCYSCFVKGVEVISLGYEFNVRELIAIFSATARRVSTSECALQSN
jgi:hypothetical protein